MISRDTIGIGIDCIDEFSRDVSFVRVPAYVTGNGIRSNVQCPQRYQDSRCAGTVCAAM